MTPDAGNRSRTPRNSSMSTNPERRNSTPQRPLDVASIVIHGDDGIEPVTDVAPPLHPTSTFAATDAAEFAAMATDTRHPRYYTRYGNPTHQRVEAVLAALEGAEAAMLTASGMGAIATAVLTLVG